jgi:choline dehydrogenase-like flavoprotein
VLDSRFRVRGVRGLRVVDACIFPRIPGYFIASAIYMISEKAFDVICEDANKEPELVAEPSRLPHSGYDKSPQRDGA